MGESLGHTTVVPTAVPATRDATVLIVEDDATVAEIVTRYLQREGYACRTVADGREALAAVEEDPPDLVVLDLMLPGLGGMEVCRRLRETDGPPIVMLTARGTAAERISGLELGADDYLVKPFSPRELVARVGAVLRRTGGGTVPPPPRTPLVAGDLMLDERARRVTIAGGPISLTALEFDLLAFLVRHPEEVLRREVLLEHVWGYRFGETSTVTVHIRRLREKIEPDPSSPRYVQTVWGVGYRFSP